MDHTLKIFGYFKNHRKASAVIFLSLMYVAEFVFYPRHGNVKEC